MCGITKPILITIMIDWVWNAKKLIDVNVQTECSTYFNENVE